MAGIIYIGISLLAYYYDNIEETKALIPLIILENNDYDLNADKLIVSCALIGYNRICETNRACNPLISISITGLSASSFVYDFNYYLQQLLSY